MVSESEMTNTLNQRFGLQLNDHTATLGETMDIYGTYVSSPDNIHDHHMQLIRKKVKYPLFASTSLDCEDPATDPFMKTEKSFRLKNGGRFISDPSLSEMKRFLNTSISFL